MPRCSQGALEAALAQLAEHSGDNTHRSNWMSTFLAACRAGAAGYGYSISGADRAVKDLFVLLPEDTEHGRINPFVRSDGSKRWLKIRDSGRSTVWNTGTRQKQTALFNQRHFGSGLRMDAIDVLLKELRGASLPARDALAVFLTRDEVWSREPNREELHEAARHVLGLSPDDFARITWDRPLGGPVLGHPEWSPELVERSALRPEALRRTDETPAREPEPDLFALNFEPEPDPAPVPQPETEPEPSQEPPVEPTPTPTENGEGFAWTQDMCARPLRGVNVERLTRRVLDGLAREHMVLPDAERLVRRCVYGLFVGNLVLQGPPGTGKTTLARLLADAFRVELIPTTATSEWSPYHVVGGFRPAADRRLAPTHGAVTDAILRCAHLVRADVQDEQDEQDEGARNQAAWLLVDEFNRADIDKAIGSLFTVLSSYDAGHLRKSPLELWFETEPDRRRLWVPARFRLIATMNDLDTSFVSQISQGLTRRFSFVTVGVPTGRATDEEPVTEELRAAFAHAHAWLDGTYGRELDAGTLEQATEACDKELARLQQVVDGLRGSGSGPGWPMGTAQIVDILRLLLLQWAGDRNTELTVVLDDAVADRVVPQMAGVGAEWSEFAQVFAAQDLGASAQALRHLADPHHLL